MRDEKGLRSQWGPQVQIILSKSLAVQGMKGDGRALGEGGIEVRLVFVLFFFFKVEDFSAGLFLSSRSRYVKEKQMFAFP